MKDEDWGFVSDKEYPTLRSEAYHKIRQMIFDETIPGGGTVVEARLVRLLGMSRTPIRAALHSLEAEGLLTPTAGGGYSVVSFTEADLVNLYQIRAALEGLASSLAATNVTRVGFAQLEDLYDEMTTACEAGNDDELVDLNRRFHRAIAAASNNHHLEGMLDTVKAVFERFRTEAVADEDRRMTAHDEHGGLMEAIRDRDPERARRLAENHVMNAFRRGTR